WRFFDRRSREITQWWNLDTLAGIEPPDQRQQFRDTEGAVDVQNPLLGGRGAARVYGPQKGLQPEDFAHAEKCLRRLAGAVQKITGVDFGIRPGSGAAGGLGFGLQAFLGA